MINELHLLRAQEMFPWISNPMVEQDLILSKVLVTMFKSELVKEKLVFRGGTALNKLFFNPPSRYSEDLDFVQRTAEPIGETINAIRSLVDDWFVKLIYF